ncbi:MAG: hypothetical protein FJ215_07555 [Ignavibacteria bacterium]|nr:hypothetical protein [Ignavibacteria bacterium]
MKLNQLIEHHDQGTAFAPGFVWTEVSGVGDVAVYPRSLNRIGGLLLFIGKEGVRKSLYLLNHGSEADATKPFQGQTILEFRSSDDSYLIRCPMNNHNARAIRDHFEFTRPRLIGLSDSFGFGCRIGQSNPGHIRSLEGSRFKPVLAQQSIRELQRTGRTPEEVLDATTWAVLQEGYRDGFGADADHLKTEQDIDLMVRAGFTMFTIDPSAYVVNDAATKSKEQIELAAAKLPWKDLRDTLASCLARYVEKPIVFGRELTISATRREILNGLVKYGGVIAHASKLYHYLKAKYPSHPAEFELSVDETDSPTTPFEHYLVVNELKRLGVSLVSVAPRFIGEFEKGIDYKGDIESFKKEYLKHVLIANALGPYKISIHSGSDKFQVYAAIGSLKRGHVHVKTAGTSYLEALRVTAAKEPALFREILDFCRGIYEEEKKTYHVSAELSRVKEAASYSDAEVLNLFEDNDARQVLHVTFGKVLTTTAAGGGFRFKDRILHCLNEYEETWCAFLEKHFRRHLDPFA